MEQRVRICDIAEELGLSTATVSNVIHGKTNKVSDATVQRVMALLEQRQYIPSMAGILLAQILTRCSIASAPACKCSLHFIKEAAHRITPMGGRAFRLCSFLPG